MLNSYLVIPSRLLLIENYDNEWNIQLRTSGRVLLRCLSDTLHYTTAVNHGFAIGVLMLKVEITMNVWCSFLFSS